MIRAGLRRLFVALLIVLGGAAAISAGVGAIGHKSILHSLAIGYYLVGAGVLVGSLALGSRGPNRIDRDPDAERPVPLGPLGILGGMAASRARRRRTIRRATPEERRESRLASLGLFAFGVLIVLLGAVLDPTRHAF